MESNSYSNQISKLNSQDDDSGSYKISNKLRKKNYEKINDEIRKRIIFEVTVLGNKLKSIWERLNINVSSAKNVLAIYKKEGRIEKKKYRVKRRHGFEKWEEIDYLSNSFMMKDKNFMIPNFGTYSTGDYTNSVWMANSQSNVSINDMSLSYLYENYWMCSYPLLSSESNSILPIENNMKNYNQYMLNYERF